VHATGRTAVDVAPLIDAAKAGAADRVAKLLRAGVDPNASGKFGLTALCSAASAGRSEVVRVLVDGGASVEMRGPLGRTPLICAAIHGNPDSLRTLLDAGADTEDTDDKGMTALHYTAQMDRFDCMRLLLRAGADAEVIDANGDTALFIAARLGRVDCTKCLLGAGADTTVLDAKKRTPLEVAELAGRPAVAQAIRLVSTRAANRAGSAAPSGTASSPVGSSAPPTIKGRRSPAAPPAASAALRAPSPSPSPPPRVHTPSPELNDSSATTHRRPVPVPAAETSVASSPRTSRASTASTPHEPAKPTPRVAGKAAAASSSSVPDLGSTVARALLGRPIFKPLMGIAEARTLLADDSTAFVVCFAASSGQFVLCFVRDGVVQQYPIVEEVTGLVHIGPIRTAFPTVVDGLRALGLDVNGPSYARYGPPTTSIADLKDALQAVAHAGASDSVVRSASLRSLNDDKFCDWLLRVSVDLESMPQQLLQSVQAKLDS